MPKVYESVAEIRRRNKDAGQHWFDPDSVRFFRSRVGRRVYGGKYFISSEQFDDSTPRRWTIRVADENGRIHEVGQFQEYDSYRAAERALQRILRGS